MEFNPCLKSATLIKRYKRFLADVTLPNGEEITIHCANTGAMTAVRHRVILFGIPHLITQNVNIPTAGNLPKQLMAILFVLIRCVRTN